MQTFREFIRLSFGCDFVWSAEVSNDVALLAEFSEKPKLILGICIAAGLQN